VAFPIPPGFIIKKLKMNQEQQQEEPIKKIYKTHTMPDKWQKEVEGVYRSETRRSFFQWLFVICLIATVIFLLTKYTT